MEDEIIRVPIDIRETVDVNVYISDIMHSVNALTLRKKWGIIGNILTHLNLQEKDKDGENIDDGEILTVDQKELVKQFLIKQLNYLDEPIQ